MTKKFLSIILVLCIFAGFYTFAPAGTTLLPGNDVSAAARDSYSGSYKVVKLITEVYTSDTGGCFQVVYEKKPGAIVILDKMGTPSDCQFVDLHEYVDNGYLEPFYVDPQPNPTENLPLGSVNFANAVNTNNQTHATVLYKGKDYKLQGNLDDAKGKISFTVKVTNIKSKTVVRDFSTAYNSSSKTLNLSSVQSLQNALSVKTLSCGQYKLEIKVTKSGYKPANRTVYFSVIKEGAATLARRMYTELLKTSPASAAWDNAYQVSVGTKTAAALIRSYTGNSSLNKLSNAEFVKRLYNAILGRTYDQGGFEHWLNCLNNGAPRSTIVNEFIASKEFESICNGWGITRGT